MIPEKCVLTILEDKRLEDFTHYREKVRPNTLKRFYRVWKTSWDTGHNGFHKEYHKPILLKRLTSD